MAIPNYSIHPCIKQRPILTVIVGWAGRPSKKDGRPAHPTNFLRNPVALKKKNG